MRRSFLSVEALHEVYHRGLSSASTMEGREILFTRDLGPFLSEGALHQYRAGVQIEVLIAFSESNLRRSPEITDEEKAGLRALVTDGFDATAVADYDHFGREGLEPMEHDVKAVETYLRERMRIAELGHLCEWLHFPMTSEDVNNLAWNGMLRDAIEQVWLPKVFAVMDRLARFSEAHAHTPIVGRTHGMRASSTTVGKRFSYILEELTTAIEHLRAVTLTGKFGGPVGNHNAMEVVAPEFGMRAFARAFVERQGYIYSPNTHQRNSHQAIVRLLNEVNIINHWLIDLCELVRHGVMMDWLYLEGKKGHVGSSAMPHKVNPWWFEVAQGYFEQSVALINAAAPGLMQSTFERDLTDHPWERAYGEMIGKSLVGLAYIVEGFASLRVNATQAAAGLDESYEVLTEAVQIAMRLEGVPNSYMIVKDRSRGKAMDRDTLHAIIREFIETPDVRERLLALTPATYVGQAAEIALETVARYRALRRPDAVIFDFDGTLQVGDKEEVFDRLTAIAERLGMVFSPDEIHAIGSRSDYREMRAYMVAEHNRRLPGQPVTEEAFQAVNDAVSGSFDDHFRLADHAKALLEGIRASGRKTGLVTTRGKKSLTRLLAAYGIAEMFDVIISRDDCAERKPHPRPLQVALEALGITSPTNAMYVGDKQIDDVIPGNLLGLTTVLVNTDPVDPNGAQPSVHVASLEPLLAW